MELRWNFYTGLACSLLAGAPTALSYDALYAFGDETRVDALSDVTLFDKSFDGPGADYVFWDPIHPTTKSHSLIADWFLAVVSPLSPQIAVAASGADLELKVGNLQSEKTYVLQSSSDLSNWSDLKNLSAGASHLFTSVPNDAARTFFRVKWRR